MTCVLVVFCMAVVSGVPAAFAEEVEWLQAWEIIEKENPGLKALREAVRSAAAGMKRQAADQRVTSSLTATGSKAEGTGESTSVGLGLRYSMSLLGREKDVLRAEEFRYERTLLGLSDARFNLYRQAATAYWSAAAGDAALAAAEEEVRRREAFLKDARLRFEQGLVPELDVIRAESALAEARHSLATKRSLRESFEAMLKGLAGWKEISPAGDVFERVELPERSGPPEYGDVLGEHPSILRQKAEIRRLEALLDAAGKGKSPILSLSATRNLYSGGSVSMSQPDDEWYGQATLEIPLTDGNKTKWAVEEARAGVELARADLSKAKASLMETLYTAWEDYTSAKEGYEAARKRFELVGREREIALLRYREGLTDQLDVLDAQVRYAESLAALIESKKEVLVADAALRAAEGRVPGEVSD
ncbi:MAG: TolC family protein [Thermovirgaceae bacterium]